MDRIITANNSKEVGTILSGVVVKSEFAEEEFASESFKCEVEDCAHDANAGMNMCRSVEFQKSGSSTNLDIKIKHENDDKSGIVHELVGYFPDGTASVKQEAHQEVCEDGIKDENFLGGRVENHFGEETFPLSVADSPITTTNVGIKSFDLDSKVCYDSSSIKLVGVSVKLKDLFPGNMRKLGKAHSNSESCSCIYCRGKYRYSCDSQHLLEDLQTRRQSSETQLLSKVQLNSIVEAQQSLKKNKKLCVAEFNEHLSLNKHRKVHQNGRPLTCKQCPLEFKQKDHLRDHVRSIHSDAKPFKCEQCTAKYKYKKNLQIHVEVHHKAGKAFECDLCSAKFKVKYYLIDHLKIHSGERPFQCDQCPAKFRRKYQLKNHVSVHSNERPFHCKQCTAKFKGNSQLETHMSVHSNERPFQCKQCPAKFKRNRQLKIHMSVHSSNERPFQCKHCPAKFKTNWRLTTHLQGKLVKCNPNFETKFRREFLWVI